MNVTHCRIRDKVEAAMWPGYLVDEMDSRLASARDLAWKVLHEESHEGYVKEFIKEVAPTKTNS